MQNNAGRGRQAPPAETDYVGFLATQPPLFHKADDPLEVDAWICTIEDKFSILNCTEVNKAAFASQQLRGTAKIWWVNHKALLPDNTRLTWDEFVAAFKSHHIPTSLMRRKMAEFLALKQGNNTVLNMLKLSISYPSMVVSMWIRMKRSRIASEGDLVQNFRTS